MSGEGLQSCKNLRLPKSKRSNCIHHKYFTRWHLAMMSDWRLTKKGIWKKTSLSAAGKSTSEKMLLNAHLKAF